eukprot:NODE_404_length_2533_cov_65.771784_g384_i0.p1 GENE.NODE_404_length_2533_cov_65.771784_g384_i0~~NODE_404_length_2533_cov_65.771784_g384_i0.p1  ORF type:complete len:802 (-),score=137.58 NODE_404_length_2533_cov_65.771784_g384_i0:128-2476(-)
MDQVRKASLLALSPSFLAVASGSEIAVYQHQYRGLAQIRNRAQKKEAERKNAEELHSQTQERPAAYYFTQHQSPVVSLFVNPLNPTEVISCCQNGVILRWSAGTFHVLDRFTCNNEVAFMKLLVKEHPRGLRAPSVLAVVVFATGSGTGASTPHGNTELSSRSSRTEVGASVLTIIGDKLEAPCPFLANLGSPPSHLAVNPNFCAYVPHLKTRTLVVEQTFASSGLHKEYSFKAPHREAITCIAVHPTMNVVSYGTVKGVVMVLTLEDQKSSSDVRRLHWHNSPVAVLEWSQDGTQMITGGEEGVVLIWNTETWRRRHVPRLTPITGLSLGDARSMLIAVACIPNIIHIINLLTHTVQESYSDVLYEPLPATSFVTVGSSVAFIGMRNVTFYDPIKFQTVDVLQVTNFNQIKSRDSESVPVHLVTHLAVSKDGVWLVTADQSDLTLNDTAEGTVRFWRRGGVTKRGSHNHTANTVVPSPHKVGITAVVFHPRHYQVVTAGKDGAIKLWQMVGRGNKRHWQCSRSMRVPEMIPRDLCFSTDIVGSLLLVAHGNKITLWDSRTIVPVNNALPLMQHLDPEPLVIVRALVDQRTVVAHSEKFLFVWDLVHQTLSWSVKLCVTAFVAFPTRPDAFGVFAGGWMMEFNSKSAAPYHVCTKQARVQSNVKSATVVRTPNGTHQVACLLDNWDGRLFTIPAEKGSALYVEELPKEVPQLVDIFTPNTRAVVAPKAPQVYEPEKQKDNKLVNNITRAQEPVNFLFVGETHQIPALSTMLDTYLNTFLEME